MKVFVRYIFTATAFLIVFFFIGCKGNPESLDSQDIQSEIQNIHFGNFLSPEAEEIVRTGVQFHDKGDYQNAINYYTRAMELAPNHPVICFEMGFSYISLNNNNAALEVAEKGLAEAKLRDYEEVIPHLMELKGAALDNLGRSPEAIDVYLEMINDYGVSSTFLYYNLAVNYYRIDKQREAEEALARGLLINPNHASSNYLLGKIHMEGGRKTQAFYALCYFLLMEPNTDRGQQSYNTILHMLRPQESIGVRHNSTFTAADMIISVAFALDEENYRLSDAEKTKIKLYYIFTNLEEQKNSGKIERSDGDNLWWDFYSPFFNRIALSDYFGTYCRYIAISADPEANNWIENGREEIEGFFDWLNEYLE